MDWTDPTTIKSTQSISVKIRLISQKSRIYMFCILLQFSFISNLKYDKKISHSVVPRIHFIGSNKLNILINQTINQYNMIDGEQNIKSMSSIKWITKIKLNYRLHGKPKSL